MADPFNSIIQGTTSYLKGLEDKQQQQQTNTNKYKLPQADVNNPASYASVVVTANQMLQDYYAENPDAAFIPDNDGLVYRYDSEGIETVDVTATRLIKARTDALDSLDLYESLNKSMGGGGSAGNPGLSYLESEQVKAKEAQRAYDDYIGRISDVAALEEQRAKANTRISDAYQASIEDALMQSELRSRGAGIVGMRGWSPTDWNRSYDEQIGDIRATIPEDAPGYYAMDPNAYAEGAGATPGSGGYGGGISIPVGVPLDAQVSDQVTSPFNSTPGQPYSFMDRQGTYSPMDMQNSGKPWSFADSLVDRPPQGWFGSTDAGTLFGIPGTSRPQVQSGINKISDLFR